MSHWIYDGKVFDPKYDEIDHAGFVYVITNVITGKKYVGRKRFHKKITRPPLKGYKRKRKCIMESDWREYCSSSQYVLADIEELGVENFKFEIISFHPNFSELNYHETKLQFVLNVLQEKDANGERVYYNENIENKFYYSDFYEDERAELHEQYNAMV